MLSRFLKFLFKLNSEDENVLENMKTFCRKQFAFKFYHELVLFLTFVERKINMLSVIQEINNVSLE